MGSFWRRGRQLNFLDSLGEMTSLAAVGARIFFEHFIVAIVIEFYTFPMTLFIPKERVFFKDEFKVFDGRL